MRVISLLGVFLSLWVASAQEGKMKDQPQEQRIRRAVPEADTDLSLIDDSPSEENEEFARSHREAQENRLRESYAAIRNMMMDLRFEKRDVPVVRIPVQRSLSVRFMCPFRDGVFLTAYCQGRRRQGALLAAGYYVDPAGGEKRKMRLRDDFYTLGFYLDLKERKIHRIRVAEVEEVYAAVVAGARAWFVGLTKGKVVLAGVGARDCITVPLPREDEIPDLGLDGPSLLVVYSKAICRLTDRRWTLVHSGDIPLPHCGLPPQRHGNTVFLRDEGGEGGIRTQRCLWGLTMGKKSDLRSVVGDTELFEPVIRDDPAWVEFIGPPDWIDTSSYCVATGGTLWVSVAHGSFLLRRSQDASYSFAIANNSVRFREKPIGYAEADQGLHISAITALPDDTLLLAGDTGLYQLKGNELVQELAFNPEEITDDSGRAVRYRVWNPSTILMLDEQSYVIGCDSWPGVYLLRKGDNGQWSCLPVDDSRNTVIW